LARDGLAVISIAVGLFLLVVLFLPGEGRVAGPLRDGLAHVFGRAAFVLPLALLLAGVVALTRSLAPNASLPHTRLIGLATLAVAALPIQHLMLSGAAGLVGQVLSDTLLELLGGAGTAFVLGVLLLAGALLTFDVPVVDLLRSKFGVGDRAES
jgi:hypothetical protein